jgi:spore coat protein U-like protein
MKKTRLSVLSLIALALSGQAMAATATTTFTSKIVIVSTCGVTATNMDFGTTGILTANIDMTSIISVTCTNLTPYNVGIGPGIMGTSVTARKMKVLAANTESISYSLYRDGARTLIWGNTLGTDTPAGMGNGLAQPMTTLCFAWHLYRHFICNCLLLSVHFQLF